MPQRGWKLADTTVNLSAAIGRKLPAGGKKEAAGKSRPPEAKEERTDRIGQYNKLCLLLGSITYRQKEEDKL